MCVGVIFLICLLIAVKLGTGYTNQRAQPSFCCTDFHCSDFGDCGTEWIDFVSTSATCFAPNSSALSFSPTADDGFYSATNESFWHYNNFFHPTQCSLEFLHSGVFCRVAPVQIFPALQDDFNTFHFWINFFTGLFWRVAPHKASDYTALFSWTPDTSTHYAIVYLLDTLAQLGESADITTAPQHKSQIRSQVQTLGVFQNSINLQHSALALDFYHDHR